MSKNFYDFKTKYISLPNKAGGTKNSEILPVAYIGGLYKTHRVMCWKLAEVHAQKVN